MTTLSKVGELADFVCAGKRDSTHLLSCLGQCSFALGILLLFFVTPSIAQESTVRKHLSVGEIPNAIAAANQLETQSRDKMLSEIARSQMAAGATRGAFFTSQQIQNDDSRSDLYGGWNQPFPAGGNLPQPGLGSTHQSARWCDGS